MIERITEVIHFWKLYVHAYIFGQEIHISVVDPCAKQQERRG